MAQRWYVNVYLEDRAYGGPEEGGWYYHTAEVLDTRYVKSESEAEILKEKLEKEYDNAGRAEISSVLSEGRYTVRIERRRGKNEPQYQPMYC